MIPIYCKITNFPLYLFVYCFENILILAVQFVHTTVQERMAGAPQRLIIGTPIGQCASYSALFCPLHSSISKEQHEKHFCNPFSHYRKYREYAREMHPKD